jgi:hypothetical protein
MAIDAVRLRVDTTLRINSMRTHEAMYRTQIDCSAPCCQQRLQLVAACRNPWFQAFFSKYGCRQAVDLGVDCQPNKGPPILLRDTKTEAKIAWTGSRVAKFWMEEHTCPEVTGVTVLYFSVETIRTSLILKHLSMERELSLHRSSCQQQSVNALARSPTVQA